MHRAFDAPLWMKLPGCHYYPPSKGWLEHHELMDKAIQFYRADFGTQEPTTNGLVRQTHRAGRRWGTGNDCGMCVCAERNRRAEQAWLEAQRRRQGARKAKELLNTAMCVDNESLDQTVIHRG